MIDFTLTEEQREIQKLSRQFAQEVTAKAPAVYKSLPTQQERFRSLLPLYRQAVSLSQIKAGIPTPLGGLSNSLIDAAIAMEEQYAVDPSLTLTVAGNLLGLMPLFFSGSKEQHERFLEPFLKAEGEPLASLVHSEPQGTANWLIKGAPGLSTTARKVGEEWVINGTKVRMLESTCV
jgi:alkylation response protein AidB-like acyl-CoA dehydrogenase